MSYWSIWTFSDAVGRKSEYFQVAIFQKSQKMSESSPLSNREFVTQLSRKVKPMSKIARETRTNQDQPIWTMRLRIQINEKNRSIFRSQGSLAAFDKENSAFIGESVNLEGFEPNWKYPKRAKQGLMNIFNRLHIMGQSLTRKAEA